MDLAFRDPDVLDRPVGDIMSPPMPMIGIGEPVGARRRVPRRGAVGARARRRPPDRRAHPLRRARLPRVDARRVSRDGDGFETRAIHVGPGARSAHRRDRPADQPCDDVRAGRGREAPRLRVRAQRQPDAHRDGDVRRVARRRAPRLRVRERPRGRGRDPAHARSRRPRDHSRPTRTAGRSGSSRACTSGTASTGPRATCATSTRVEAAWHDETRLVWIETPTNPMLSIVDIEAVAKFAHERDARGRRRQHVRDAVPATAARARRRRRRCTRRRSISAVTPTSSAGSSRSTTPSGPTSCASSRTRWERCRRRSTATSCCGA